MNRDQFNEAHDKLLKQARRRAEVLKKVLAGHADDEIAQLMDIHEGTVRNQISKIYKNFGIKGNWEGDRHRRREDLVALFASYKPDLLSDKLPTFGSHTEFNSVKPAVEIESPTDDLSTEREVDYARLRDLLAAGKWWEANRETGTVILSASGREKLGCSEKDIRQFPCTDLRTINQLWVKYSNERFGFSVQKRILENLGGTKDADWQTFYRFGDSVGWRVKGSWIRKVKYTIDAPMGHLPDLEFSVSLAYLDGFKDGYKNKNSEKNSVLNAAWMGRKMILYSLAYKLAVCNIH